MTCSAEMVLDFSISNDDKRLSILGCSMVRADHPSNTKRGGVCLCYKEHLPIIGRDDISNIKECLVTEITVKNERCFLTCLCRFHRQNREQFQSFCNSLDINSLIPAISINTEDFNRKCLKYYFLILVAILERNLILLHRLRGMVKLLTSQTILQAIHFLALTLFLHFIVA